MFKAKILALCLLLTVVGSGCQLEEKINTVRQTKYAADDAFAASSRNLVELARTGWNQKHDLQRLIYTNTFLTWLQNNGAKFDEKGEVVGGTLPADLLWKSLKVRDKQLADLALSESKANKLMEKALQTIDAYVASNKATYKTEQEAHEAMQSAYTAYITAMEGIGAFAGGAAAAAAVGL